RSRHVFRRTADEDDAAGKMEVSLLWPRLTPVLQTWWTLINVRLQTIESERGKTAAQPAHDSLTDHVSDLRAGRILQLSQHGSDDAILVIPADEISVAQAGRQTREQLGGKHRIDVDVHSRLLFQVQQQQKERAVRALTALPLDVHEVAERVLVVRR